METLGVQVLVVHDFGQVAVGTDSVDGVQEDIAMYAMLRSDWDG